MNPLSEKASPAPLPRNVRVLGWASLLNDTASEAVAPLLPRFITHTLGGSRFDLAWIEGAGETLASLLKLAMGYLSDRLPRRKPLVVAGYALAALARPCLAWAGSAAHVLAVRLCDRTGKGVRTAPRDALIVESTPPAALGAAFGYHRAMDHLGAAFGPLVALLWLQFWPHADLRWLFLATLLPGLCVVACVLLGLRESPRDGTAAEPPSQPPAGPTPVTPDPAPWSLAPANQRAFRRYLAALLVFTLGNSSDAFLLLRAEELGVGASWLPGLWFAFHLLKSGGNLLGGRCVGRCGARPLVLVGWLLYAGVYAGFAAADSAWQAWLLFAAYAGYFALAEPAEKTLVAQLTGGRRQGRAFGWFHLVLGLAALPANLLLGGLYERYSAQAAFGCGAALALAASILLCLVRAESNEEPPTP